MKDYEILYVMKPDTTDQDKATLRTEVKTRIETLSGTVEKESDWGKRQLAFEIRDHTEGFYTYVHAKLPSDSPNKLKDLLKIDDRIIRHMITVKQPVKILKRKAEKKKTE